MRFAVTIALIAVLQPQHLHAQQRACEPAKIPKQLPAVGALVDSTSAVRALAAIDAPEGMLFGLAILEGDSVPLVRPLFGTDSTAAGILVGFIRPQRRADESWAVRLRAGGGPSLVLRIERAMYCPPKYVPGSQSTGVFTFTTEQRPDDRALRSAELRGPIGFMALVSKEGIPLRVNMIGSTGLPELDEQAKENWRNSRFQPALLDGLPIKGWYRSDQARPRPRKLPPADDDSVYLESEVDERPFLISRPVLAYPDRLREAGIQGHVVVEAIIDKNGRAEPQSVRVIETPDNGFNSPATTMVLSSRFQPASIHGRAVRVRVKMPIDFSIKN